MADPLSLGAMMVSGAPLAQPTTTSFIPKSYRIEPFVPYSDPFASGYLNPAYRDTSGVKIGYGPSGELIDTITGRRINQFGFNNPYDKYKANVPTTFSGVAAGSGMPGAFSVTPDYAKALEDQKLAEYKMFLHQNDPSLTQRARRGEGYLKTYEELKPLQVQQDVAQGRVTPQQAQAWLMLQGTPNQVGGGFADQLSDWERTLANDRAQLAALEAELAGYGEDPRYAVQRASVADRINTQRTNIIPRREQTLREMQETIGQYTPALGGYEPGMAAAPYAELAAGSAAELAAATAQRDAQRKALEEANRIAEEASANYKVDRVEGWNEEENARRFAANIASRNALTDFIAANRKSLAKGGLAVKKFWDKPRPEGQKPKTLSTKKKAAAKRRAKAAGRPYPNLVDNAFAARKKGK